MFGQAADVEYVSLQCMTASLAHMAAAFVTEFRPLKFNGRNSTPGRRKRVVKCSLIDRKALALFVTSPALEFCQSDETKVFK